MTRIGYNAHVTAPKTASQTETEIRAEIAPLLAAFITRAANHDMVSESHPTVNVFSLGGKVIYWSAKVEPKGVTQWAGFVIHTLADRPAKLGSLSESQTALDWARSQLTDRQADKVVHTSWSY